MSILDLTNIQKYSYSKLCNYEQCPYQYWLQYCAHTPRDDNNGFAEAGSIAHEIIDGFYKKKFQEEELPLVFQDRWNEKFTSEGKGIFLFGNDLSDKYYSQLLDYFENFQGYTNCDVIETEKTFSLLVKYPDVSFILTGIIDCIAKEGNDIIIWDSKSKSQWKDENELKKYTRQLYVYSAYIKQVYGKFPTKLKFNMFRVKGAGRVTEIPFDEHEFNRVMDWVHTTVNDIQSEQFYLANFDKFYCNALCDYRHSCDCKDINPEDIY